MSIAFVVPSLGPLAAQDEDVVQLLLVAAARLDDGPVSSPQHATLVVVDGDSGGWPALSELFAADALDRISLEPLPQPRVPGLDGGNHAVAYALVEHLAAGSFAEVHCLDYGGWAHHATQARRLGLACLDAAFVVHVVGSSLYRLETEERLLDDVSLLADDLLERGGVARADAVVVHDRHAWEWYAGKVARPEGPAVHDLDGAETSVPRPGGRGQAAPNALAFYGPLGADGGLPLFCDAVDRLAPRLERAVEVVFVGPPRALSGMDAVTYVRTRAAGWQLPVTIRRDLSIADELTFLSALDAVVVTDIRRRNGLRARLAASAFPARISPRSDNPGPLADALEQALRETSVTLGGDAPRLVEVWQSGRPSLPASFATNPEPPLERAVDGPKVSVCVTHFRRLDKLRTALDSLAEQTYRNFEVVVVDDGSGDEATVAELERVRAEIKPRGWALVFQENRYLGAARNQAARHASGEYLLFMDDDNVARPEELATLVAAARRSGADVVTTFYDGFEGDEAPSAATEPVVRFTPFGELDPALGLFTNCFGDANALWRREAFERLGGFTEDYGITHEDWELFCRAALDGLSMACVTEPLFWYRVDPGGMFRGDRKQLHETTNRRRHARPYAEKLSFPQAKLAQLAQGLAAELPLVVGREALVATPARLRRSGSQLPYARVAVIVRTKDRPLLLRRAVESVLGQTYADWLLVIVNDGGERERIDLVLHGLRDRLLGRVLVLDHPVSLGMQTASNAGIASCDSDFVVIHDDDDSWAPTFLARTLSYLDEHGWDARLGGVVTLSELIIEDIGEHGEIVPRDRFVFNPELEALSLADLAVENRFPPISLLFRRSAFEAVGPFDQAAGPLGDWDFHLRLLARYDVGVIREPLALYHHRHSATTGVYGNSVHVDSGVHRAKRAELVNRAIRGSLGRDGAGSLAGILTLGELEHRRAAEQQRQLQGLRDYIWTLEQTVNRIAERVGAGSAEPGRNAVANGDFRLWPGPGAATASTDGGYALQELAPGVLLSYDGSAASYRVEQRAWTSGPELPSGKTYLHLEQDGTTRGGSWFALDVRVPAVARLAGRTICVSGVARMQAVHTAFTVAGRHVFPDGRQLAWPEATRALGERWSPWSVIVDCPALEPGTTRAAVDARLILRLPHDEPFELDLTDLQVEPGGTPTAFEFRSPGAPQPRRRRLRRMLRAARRGGGARGAGT